MKNNKSQKNIPDEWLVKSLGDFLVKMEGGGTPSKENPNYWVGSIPWASVKDIVTHNPNDTQDHISEAGLKNSSSRLVSKGILIVPTRMALGHAVFFNVDVAINQDLKALYPKKDLLNKYLFYWFKHKKEFIKRLGSGSTVSGIQQNELKRIKFNLPSLPEQNRIVAVLEVWDGAIEKLGKKIEIKKRIKKGIASQILNCELSIVNGKKIQAPKLRLPSFSGEWETVKLGDVCNIKKGKQLNKHDMIINGKYPALNGGIGASGYTNEWNTKENTVTISEGGNSCGYLNFNKEKFWCGGHCYAINPKKNIDNLYLYQSLKVKQSKIMCLRVGSGLPNIQKKALDNLILEIPKTQKEQTAIAQILTTADLEIETLEKKKKIIEDQKKFLLNNLITGKIRTPEGMK